MGYLQNASKKLLVLRVKIKRSVLQHKGWLRNHPGRRGPLEQAPGWWPLPREEFTLFAEAHVLDLPGQRGPGQVRWREAGRGLNTHLARRKWGKTQRSGWSPPSSLIPLSGHPGLAPGCAWEKGRN